MSKPVIVYGASGYTGRLVCEYLREYNVPFIAAGRDKARIQEAMDKVPGIDTIEHDVEPLSELFDGAKVVLNTVGPFAQYGREVVEACINTGCHYLDTTGEQDWLIVCDEEYSQRMAEKNLLLAPGVAQMYTTSEIAAQLCLEKPGVDTLDHRQSTDASFVSTPLGMRASEPAPMSATVDGGMIVSYRPAGNSTVRFAQPS